MTAVEGSIVSLAIGIGLLIGLLLSAKRRDMEKVVLFGMAIITGLISSDDALIVITVLFCIVLLIMGYSRLALFAIGGCVLGIALYCLALVAYIDYPAQTDMLC